MWTFGRHPSKSDLKGEKSVKINGFLFRIRPLNPILDFREDNMPQVFAAYGSRRKTPEEPLGSEKLRRAMADIKATIEVGLVEPRLVPVGVGEAKGNEPGTTIEDVMRDQDTAGKLYWEIIVHSLCRFKGLRGIFFSARLRHSLSMLLQRDTANFLTKSPSEMASSA